MALSAAERRLAARELAGRFYSGGTTANMNWDDFTAAIGAIDDTMDKLPANLTAGQTVKVNLVNSLPEPFKSNSTTAQKAMALMVWAMKESGII